MSVQRAFSRVCIAVVFSAALLGSAGGARADVVDDAYAAGSAAAAEGDWPAAIEHWQEALELLPGRSAQLDYDLGTAYAQVGDLGRATYHLQRSLQPEARPSVEIAESARRNLGFVRRRAEVAAEVTDARISRPKSSWDLVVEVLAGRALAWISLIASWLVLGTIVFRARKGHRVAQGLARASETRGISGALVLVFTSILILGGGLHALAVRTALRSPDAIVVEPVAQVREAPGAHLPTEFSIQGGSRVRVLEERSGWARVRLPGGLEGWTRATSVARLDQ